MPPHSLLEALVEKRVWRRQSLVGERFYWDKYDLTDWALKLLTWKQNAEFYRKGIIELEYVSVIESHVLKSADPRHHHSVFCRLVERVQPEKLAEFEAWYDRVAPRGQSELVPSKTELKRETENLLLNPPWSRLAIDVVLRLLQYVYGKYLGDRKTEIEHTIERVSRKYRLR